MEYNEIRALIKKYHAGETDLSEERLLKEFFSTDPDVPDDLVADKYLFLAYHIDSHQPILNEDLVSEIKFPTDKKVIPIWKKAFRYAAVVLPLAIVIGYVIVQRSGKPASGVVLKETIKDETKAIQEAGAALEILSVAMRDGLENAKQLDVLKEVGDKLNQGRTQKIKK